MTKPSTSTEIIAKSSFNPLALAQAETTGRAELALLRGADKPGGMLDVSAWDADDVRDVNEYLRERLREQDSIVQMRERAKVPIKLKLSFLDELCEPVLSLYELICTPLREAIGRYQLLAAQRQREQLLLAQEAVDDASPEALTEALTAAAEVAPEKLAGTTVREVWKIKRIVPELLPAQWFIPATPDEKKIKAFGKAHGPDDEPVIPGVVWERGAAVTVRR